MSSAYKDFVDYIDHVGGIYKFRWGDASIKTIAVTLFVQKNVTHQFNAIGYQHQYVTT